MLLNTDNKVLAIVGGGSISTSVVCQLVDEITLAGGCDIACILVFDPCVTIGAGVAYQLDNASNLLNTRAGAMSPIDSRPDHFLSWLRANEQKWKPVFPQVCVSEDGFFPRGLFGLYLENIFQDSKQALHERGVSVQHIRADVSGVAVISSGYALQTCLESYFADYIILAVGNLQSSDWSHLLQEAGYFSSPYPCSSLIEHIDTAQSVCILGSGVSEFKIALTDPSIFDKAVANK